MERITGNIYEEIFSDPAKNGPFSVELSQIAIGLRLWHVERLSPFPQQPLNSLEFRFCLFPLSKQHADGKRREHRENPPNISALADVSQGRFPCRWM